MKFKWKLFLSMMLIVTIAYSVSGSIMITSTFRATYDKEVEFAKEEHEILQNTFIMVLSRLNSNVVTDEVVRQIAKELDDSSEREDFFFWLKSEDNLVLYQSNSMRVERVALYQNADAEKLSGCYLYTTETQYYLMTSSYMSTDAGMVFLNTVRDVTDIFATRDEQFDIFYQIMFILMAVTAVISYLIAAHLTKPLSRLSRVTRQISEGNLKIRTNLYSSDEIGELATDIDEMATSLEQNIAQLNDAVRRQEDFVGNFAHELKTPLTSIIGYADMLRSRKMSQENIFSAANYIFTEGKRLEGMSFKLMELIVTKQKPIQLKRIDADYFFEQVHGSLQPLLSKEEVGLNIEVDSGYLMGDTDLLKSVVFNLVDNARKAKNEDEETTVWIYGQALEDEYKIIIKDNGKGVPKEELDKITEAFYMVDKSRAREQGGAGLGLALCTQIMQAHEGKMEIASEQGKGTMITLTLKGGVADE